MEPETAEGVFGVDYAGIECRATVERVRFEDLPENVQGAFRRMGESVTKPEGVAESGAAKRDGGNFEMSAAKFASQMVMSSVEALSAAEDYLRQAGNERGAEVVRSAQVALAFEFGVGQVGVTPADKISRAKIAEEGVHGR